MLPKWLRLLFEKKRPPLRKTQRRERGRLGEDAAENLLRKSGFKIVMRNCRIGGGELDIVARDGPCLVFVEVRARDEAALVDGFDSLTRRKRAAFARAAHAYLRALAPRVPPVWRFDVVAVRLKKDGAVSEIFHYRNVRV